MLRAIANIYIESQALPRRDAFKIFRVCNYSTVPVNDKDMNCNRQLNMPSKTTYGVEQTTNREEYYYIGVSNHI
ncbi:jg262 [Pararge aegeria aegeria]|uniref:Jg262 protein n=1 Tax=Pararge aegeria aegeria TaxID=348720 RepID=A0A8S4QW38_9NEOP|nr:jg262 [Pararge aegeria aegeria]